MELLTQVSDCYPVPEISWFKDDSKLASDSEHILLETNKNEHKLTIQSTNENDKGKYVFKAQNELGSDETSCSSTILCKYFTQFTLIIVLFFK